MLNREKIRLMTDLAMYEKQNEDMVFKVNEYYRTDYILWHGFMAFIRYSLCFLVILFMYIFCKIDYFFYSINLNGIYEILRTVMFFYLSGLIIYLIITWMVYAYRYKRARKGMLLYASKLKRLARRYKLIDKERR